MTNTVTTFCALALLTPLIAGCAGDSGRYPSLAVRDVERVNGEFESGSPVQPVELQIPPLVPSTSIESLVEQANAANSTFASRVAAARGLATNARGSGRDSEARGRAIVALADLTSLRSQTEVPLGELDLLIAERTNRLEPAADAIAAHARVLALVQEQSRTLDELWRMVGR